MRQWTDPEAAMRCWDTSTLTRPEARSAEGRSFSPRFYEE
jgi:hypothetical protein